MNADKLLQISTYAGRILLESGAEIYRVEDTMNRICFSYGFQDSESFVTATGIIASIYDDGKNHSTLKRITKRGINLNKIDKVNALSRRISQENISLDELYTELKIIDNEKVYANKVTVLFAGFTAASFSFIFSGNIYDCFVSFIIGSILQAIAIRFRKISINEFFINFTCSAGAAFGSILCHYLFSNTNIDKVIIGVIMLFVPGLAITNAVRDIIAGDYLAGITKGAEAILVAISVAAGSGVVLGLWINAFGGKLL